MEASSARDSDDKASRLLTRIRAPIWHETRRVTVVVPLASVEQHGPHLPLGTDLFIPEAIAEAASRRSRSIIVAPTIPFGVAPRQERLLGGAISVKSETLTAYLMDVLVAITRDYRAAFLLNGHGGNWSAITMALDSLGATHRELPVAACCWWHLVPDQIAAGEPDAMRGEIGHAGSAETSVVRAISPELVRADSVPPGTALPPTPATAQDDGALDTAVWDGIYKWVDYKSIPHGVTGTPSLATAEDGNQLLQTAADRLTLVAEALARQVLPPPASPPLQQ